MRVFSVQPVSVVNRLERDQVVQADRSMSHPEFLFAYDWISEQMSRRLKTGGERWPWWGWLDWTEVAYGASTVPDDEQIWLEIELPKDKVLLCDYTTWHLVLARAYVALTADEDEAWEREMEAAGLSRGDWPLPEPWQTRLLASWERIFDLDALKGSEYWGSVRAQALFAPLELASVVARHTCYERLWSEGLAPDR